MIDKYESLLSNIVPAGIDYLVDVIGMSCDVLRPNNTEEADVYGGEYDTSESYTTVLSGIKSIVPPYSSFSPYGDEFDFPIETEGVAYLKRDDISEVRPGDVIRVYKDSITLDYKVVSVEDVGTSVSIAKRLRVVPINT